MSRHVETGDVWVVWKPWMEVQYNRACMVWSCTPKVLPLLQSLSNPHEVSSGKILFFTLPNKHSENPMRNHSERCRTAQCFATQAAVLSFQHKASFLSHLDLFFFFPDPACLGFCELRKGARLSDWALFLGITTQCSGFQSLRCRPFFQK